MGKIACTLQGLVYIASSMNKLLLWPNSSERQTDRQTKRKTRKKRQWCCEETSRDSWPNKDREAFARGEEGAWKEATRGYKGKL